MIQLLSVDDATYQYDPLTVREAEQHSVVCYAKPLTERVFGGGLGEVP